MLCRTSSYWQVHRNLLAVANIPQMQHFAALLKQYPQRCPDTPVQSVISARHETFMSCPGWTTLWIDVSRQCREHGSSRSVPLGASVEARMRVHKCAAKSAALTTSIAGEHSRLSLSRDIEHRCLHCPNGSRCQHLGRTSIRPHGVHENVQQSLLS